MFDSLGVPCASFVYNEKPVLLVPEQMQKTGDGIYESVLPCGLTAVLERRSPAPGAVWQQLRFEHRGQGPSGTLSEIAALDAAESAFGDVLFESLKGDSCGAESFNPVIKSLLPGDSFRVEPKSGRPSDTTGFPFFDLAFGGAAAAFAIGWGGQWFLELARGEESVRVKAGLADVSTFLFPGESVTCPTVLWTNAREIPAARRALRRLLFDRFSPKGPEGGPVKLPVALSCYDRFHDEETPVWATVEGQKKCADAAAAAGMDTLWLDAAWFEGKFPNGVGNYSYAPGFPDGLGPVADYAHGKGLRFLLWFEPERANCYSETAREHPEDIIVPDSHASVNCLVDFGREETRRRMTDLLSERIRDGKLDIYRQDYNICPAGYWRAADAPGRRGMTEIRFVEGHRKTWDDLLARFPGLLIDNCASGGRRLDFESLSRSVPLWRSDTGCSPVTDRHRGHIWSQNHILALTRYLPYHSCGTWDATPYHVRSTAAGGVCCDFDYTAPDFSAAALRPLTDEVHRLQKYWAGDFYPLTAPTNDESVWAAWQLSLGGSGAVWAFRRDACEEAQFTLRLSDIDPAKTYEVRLTDEALHTETRTLSGDALANLTLTCNHPAESVVLEYEEVASGENNSEFGMRNSELRQ